LKSNACSFLRELFKLDRLEKTRVISKASLQVMLSEPNAAAILRVLGLIKLHVSDIASFLKPEATIELIGISGDTIELRGKGTAKLLAELPLETPSMKYRGPYYQHVQAILASLTNLLDADKVPLLTDTHVVRWWKTCKPKLGCMPSRQYKPLNSELDLGVLFPRVIYPTILGWARGRLRKAKRIEAPWLCIGHKGLYLNILCQNEACVFQIEPTGHIMRVKGTANYFSSTRCSKTKLFIDYFLGNSYGSIGDIEVRIPAMWSPTLLIPLGIELLDNDRLEICVWNPLPMPKLHEIVFEKHRVVEAWQYAPETSDWEPIEPSYNRIRIGLRTLGIARVRVVLRKIPPLLIRH